MKSANDIGLQFLIFSLVAAAFTMIYLPQPVLPVIRAEFGVTESRVSLLVSAVIFGMALSNLPFGVLADRYPVRPLFIAGGTVIALAGLFCAATRTLWLMVAARFLQGLFVPSLTTCLVVSLVRNLPPERLNVVTGSYVAATVAGGLGGRLLGGLIHVPAHWRYAFVTSSALLLCATVAAAFRLPGEKGRRGPEPGGPGFATLLRDPRLRRSYLVAFGGFFVFSSIFNYLPFYLAGPPFEASVHLITLLYLSYGVGIFAGPLSGKLSNRVGNGATMALGSALFAAAIGATFVPALAAVVVSLPLVCAGFFSIHAAAAGSLNRNLGAGRGRANSLYVLFYYLGGSLGITAGGHAYQRFGWRGVAGLGILMLALPFAVGIRESRERHTSVLPSRIEGA
ncbi:MAG: MFS transporter [Gemmatimonadota bacterium]